MELVLGFKGQDRAQFDWSTVGQNLAKKTIKTKVVGLPAGSGWGYLLMFSDGSSLDDTNTKCVDQSLS